MTTKAAKTHPRISVTLSPGQSPGDFPTSPEKPVRTPAAESAAFPVSAIVRELHPRLSAWAGLAEAGQILCEAESAKGAPLSQEELRQLQETYLDAYDKDWNFGRRGISDAWVSGWEHAFALYAQQVERLRSSEPVHGIGLVFCPRAASGQPDQSHSPVPVRFRSASILVESPEDFLQGIWEGQLAALDAQPCWQQPGATGTSGPLSSARFFDDLLDLFYESGNHGLDFVVGYVLGNAEGLLCGRTCPPTRVQGETASASAGSAENS